MTSNEEESLPTKQTRRSPVDGIDVSVSPLVGAGFWSRLTFQWMNHFIMVGRNKTLTEEHMPELW
jgi:hypothetical protein